MDILLWYGAVLLTYFGACKLKKWVDAAARELTIITCDDGPSCDGCKELYQELNCIDGRPFYLLWSKH